MHASKTKWKNIWIFLAVLFSLNYLSSATANALKIRQQSDSSEIPTSLRNQQAPAPGAKAPEPKVAELSEFVAYANAGVPFTSAEAAEPVFNDAEVPLSEHVRARNSITLNS